MSELEMFALKTYFDGPSREEVESHISGGEPEVVRFRNLQSWRELVITQLKAVDPARSDLAKLTAHPPRQPHVVQEILYSFQTRTGEVWEQPIPRLLFAVVQQAVFDDYEKILMEREGNKFIVSFGSGLRFGKKVAVPKNLQEPLFAHIRAKSATDSETSGENRTLRIVHKGQEFIWLVSFAAGQFGETVSLSRI